MQKKIGLRLRWRGHPEKRVARISKKSMVDIVGGGQYKREIAFPEYIRSAGVIMHACVTSRPILTVCACMEFCLIFPYTPHPFP